MTSYIYDLEDKCELCSAHISEAHETLCDYSDDKNLVIAEVAKLPKCDFCNNEAQFDGKMRGLNMWAYFCYECFYRDGIGELGTGKAQALKEAN